MFQRPSQQARGSRNSVCHIATALVVCGDDRTESVPLPATHRSSSLTNKATNRAVCGHQEGKKRRRGFKRVSLGAKEVGNPEPHGGTSDQNLERPADVHDQEEVPLRLHSFPIREAQLKPPLPGMKFLQPSRHKRGVSLTGAVFRRRTRTPPRRIGPSICLGIQENRGTQVVA
jgi:hypothetical protein